MPTFDELYKYHSFSKAPAAAGLTTGQSVNKAGHTVAAKDVWAFDVPYMFKVNNLSDLTSKSPKLNDLAWVGAEKKYCQFNGTSWTDITSTIATTVLKNADGKDVLKFHKGLLTPLDNSNNAGVTSNGQAYRFFVDGKPVQRWVASTDCIDETGFPSLGYNVIVIKNSTDTLLDGTDFYADYYGGTIFFTSGQSTSTKFEISCFEYVGKYVSEELGGIANFQDNRRGEITENDIWGRTVNVYKKDKLVRIEHKLVSSLAATDEWKAQINYVIDNKVFDSDNNFISNLETDKLADGVSAFENSPITYYNSDLSNLYSGDKMFKNTTISTFNTPLPKLIYAPEMFKGSKLTSFNETLSSLTYGVSMFEDTESLKTVTSNTKYLLIGDKMFKNTALESFSGSLPYLYSGAEMFKDTNLSVINSKFSSLITGVGMFENTLLTLDSLETIAKSLPCVNYRYLDEDDNICYYLGDGMTYYYIQYSYDDETQYIIGKYIPYKVPADIIGEITFTWKNTEELISEGTVIAIREYFRWMQLLGWTVITNITDKLEDGEETDNPTIWARVYDASEEDATHTMADGSKVKLSTSPYVYLPVNMFEKEAKYTWKEYASIEDAQTQLGLTPIA